MNQQLAITKDEANGNRVLRDILLTVAEGYDRVRPGAGDCVREMAEEKYPEDRHMTLSEFCQHLANLCPRHIRHLLPTPTASICMDCAAERESPTATNSCFIAECPSPVIARGWCSKHYRRWKKHGDPLKALPRGFRNGNVSGGRITPEYQAWRAMNARCSNPNVEQYPNYGGRGIKVCERWKNSYQNFLADVGPRPGAGYSLDRYPNKNGNYEPGNVRWTTAKEQALNTRRNHLIEIDGVTRPLGEWSEISGVGRDCIVHRLKAGKSAREAVFTPSIGRKRT